MSDRFHRKILRKSSAWALTAGFLMAGGAQSATVYFEDDFDAASLNASIWDASFNGSGNVIDLADSWVDLAAGYTLDAPYVRTAAGVNPFPTSGDFAVEVRFRYTQIANKGTGLQLLDEAGNALAGFWADSTGGLRGGAGGDVVSLTGSPTEAHRIRWEFVGQHVSLFHDGNLLGTFAVSARPEALWFGHPSIGQQLAANASPSISSYVDGNGYVQNRWWGNGEWTDLSLDYIRVSAVPLPAAVWLFGSGLIGMAAVGRRRR